MDFNILINYGRRAMSLEVPFYEEAAQNLSLIHI